MVETKEVEFNGKDLNCKYADVIENVVCFRSYPYETLACTKNKKKCVLNFIWEGKPLRITYNVLIGATDEGGMGLIDPEIRKKSMRVKVVKRFLNKDFKAEWKYVMKYYLNKCGDFNMNYDILWMKLKQNMMTGIPDFYKEVLQAWAEFLNFVEFKPEGRKMLLNQPLFLNANILIQEKEVFFKHWLKAGVCQVKDVLYEKRFFTKPSNYRCYG